VMGKSPGGGQLARPIDLLVSLKVFNALLLLVLAAWFLHRLPLPRWQRVVNGLFLGLGLVFVFDENGAGVLRNVAFESLGFALRQVGLDLEAHATADWWSQYAGFVLIGCGTALVMPLLAFLGVSLTERKVAKELHSFDAETFLIPQGETDILDSDGLYAIVRPDFAEPNTAMNEGFSFGGWCSRLVLPKSFGANYYAIRRTTLVPTPIGIEGDEFTGTLGRIFRGLMISHETGSFIDELRKVMQRPWCVKRFATEASSVLTKAPWDSPDVLVLFAQKQFEWCIPVGAGLLDRDGLCYEASFRIEISLTEEARGALEELETNPVS